MLLITTIALFLISTVYAQETIYLTDNDNVIWSNTNETSSFYIEADNGWISATIKAGFLNFNDYVIITTNNSAYPQDGLVFAYNFSQSTYLFHTNTIYCEANIQDNSVAVVQSSFEVEFKKIEEPLTTTQAPSTTEGYLPTPASNETETNFTVYIAGKTADEYRDEDVILEFKNALLTMAGNYCTQNMNVVLSDEITINNILISLLEQCPINWPNYETCVKITFAIPIIYVENDFTTGYQLSTGHLQRMWEIYGEQLLPDGLEIYEEPIISTIVKFWLAAIIITLILFMALQIFVRYFSSFNLFSPKRILNQIRHSYEEFTTKKDDVIRDLDPHYYQDVPSFILNEDLEKGNHYAEPFEEEVRYTAAEGFEIHDNMDDINNKQPALIHNMEEGESGA